MKDQLDLLEDFALEPERYELRDDPEFSVQFGLDLDRRAFLKTLGSGLVILCLMSEADAATLPSQQQRRRPNGGGGGAGNVPREIEAWVHIAENGRVQACSGKAEVGQNARTSLTQAVADELGLAPESVQMILGDTDLVPYDMGTFGSRTTPTMVPQLRRAAAAARSVLVKLGAEKLGVAESELQVGEGKVKHEKSGQSTGFGDLMKGRKFVQLIEADTAITAPDRWKVAGTSVPKVDGRSFVTGTHKYTSDLARPGLLHGKVLRPPAFEAKLISVDLAKAQAIPGVVVVREGDFIGLAAPDESTARRALALIDADWKTTDQPSNKAYPASFKEDRDEARPVHETTPADTRIKASYEIAYIAHAPLEPRSALADWDGEKLQVWTGTQRPFGVRSELARAFNLPEDRIRVIVPDTGSGYGGKHTGEAAIEAARLARAIKGPVKLVWTREEEFTWAYFRPGGLIEVEAGASKDGTITYWDFHNYNSGGSGIESPYTCARASSRFHQAKSPLKQGSYRALASTANHFARESAIDELAHGIEADPLAFRLKNLKEPRLRAVLEAAARSFGWGAGKPAPGRGFGLACGMEKGGIVATCAEVEANETSGEIKVIRLVTAFECGAIINPVHLKNQVEGALVMGLGGALFEAIRFADGKILNPRFSRYRVPRFSDLPRLETILIDRKDLPSAGAGETPIVAVAPAIANALFQATGKRLRSMPMTPAGLKG